MGGETRGSEFAATDAWLAEHPLSARVGDPRGPQVRRMVMSRREGAGR